MMASARRWCLPAPPHSRRYSVLLYCLVVLLAAALCPGIAPLSATAAAMDVEARIGSHWQDILRVCPNRTYVSCSTVDQLTWSSAATTRLEDFKFEGFGLWSTLKLISFDQRSAKRMRGGDLWHIILRDAEQHIRVPTRVFDEGDGTYTVAVIILQPGNYTVVSRLLYSDCHGYQEPWCDTDHYMKQLKKDDHCYVGTMHIHPLPNAAALPPLLTTPGAGAAATADCGGAAGKLAVPSAAAGGGPARGAIVRMEYYHTLQNFEFRVLAGCRRRLLTPPKPTTRLVLWGDSTVKQHWEHLMAMARHPCIVAGQDNIKRLDRGGRWLIDENLNPSVCPGVSTLAEADPALDVVAKKCTAGAPWTTVPIGTNTHHVSNHYPDAILFDMPKFTYNSTFAVPNSPPPREFTFIYMNGWGIINMNEIKDDMANVRDGDVVIFNAGAHQQREHSFETWRNYVDDICAIFTSEMLKHPGAVFVWRSSFMMKEYVFRKKKWADGYVGAAHFNTDARRVLFDSYAEHAMLKAGVHVWDVYGMSSVSGHKLSDMVHVDFWTIRAMDIDMLDLMCPA